MDRLAARTETGVAAVARRGGRGTRRVPDGEAARSRAARARARARGRPSSRRAGRPWLGAGDSDLPEQTRSAADAGGLRRRRLKGLSNLKRGDGTRGDDRGHRPVDDGARSRGGAPRVLRVPVGAALHASTSGGTKLGDALIFGCMIMKSGPPRSTWISRRRPDAAIEARPLCKRSSFATGQSRDVSPVARR